MWKVQLTQGWQRLRFQKSRLIGCVNRLIVSNCKRGALQINVGKFAGKFAGKFVGKFVGALQVNVEFITLSDIFDYLVIFSILRYRYVFE